MKRTYCDACQQEITEENEWRGINVNIANAHFFVARREKCVEDVAVDICVNCVLDAIACQDKRPKLAPAPNGPY